MSKNSSHQIKNKYLFLLLSTLCKKNKENSSTSISLLPLHALSYWSMYIRFYWVWRNVWRCSQINGMFSRSSWEIGPILCSQAPWAVLLQKKNPFQPGKHVEELELLASLCKARLGVLSGIDQSHPEHIKEQSLRHTELWSLKPEVDLL